MDDQAKELIKKYQYPNKTGDTESVRTTSNVGFQDEITLEDTSSFSELTAEALSNSVKSIGAGIISKYASGIDSIVSSITGNSATHTDNKDPFEETNGINNAFKDIEELRSNIAFRKTIKTSALIGTYNSLTNLVGLAGIICAGSLGNGSGYSWSSNASTTENILKSLDIGSGAWGLLGVRATTKSGWVLDADEITALNSVTFNNFLGNKPGLKTGLGSGRPARHDTMYEKVEEARSKLKARKNAFRTIGRLYIEPYYNSDDFECFSIPFEFNPSITEGSIEAKYNSTQIMNRVTSIQTYISTESQNVQIETMYLALAPDNASVSSNTAIASTDAWEFDWTVKQIEKTELQLRSLVMPSVTGSSFVRPPMVQIILEASSNNPANAEATNESDKTYSYVSDEGDLFKYPHSPEYNSNYLKSSTALEEYTRRKRYIVTNVQITPLEDFGLTYAVPDYSGITSDSTHYRRNGFKVSLSLTEVTKNFTDIVPDYRAYYNAWQNIEKDSQNTSNEYKVDYSEVTSDNILSEFNQAISDFWEANESYGKYVKKNYNNLLLNELEATYLSTFNTSGTTYAQEFKDSITSYFAPESGDTVESYYKSIKGTTSSNLYEKISSSSLYSDIEAYSDTELWLDNIDEFYKANVKIITNAETAYQRKSIIDNLDFDITTDGGNIALSVALADCDTLTSTCLEAYESANPGHKYSKYAEKICDIIDDICSTSTGNKAYTEGAFATQQATYSNKVSSIETAAKNLLVNEAQDYVNIINLYHTDVYVASKLFSTYICELAESKYGKYSFERYVNGKCSYNDKKSTPYYCSLGGKLFIGETYQNENAKSVQVLCKATSSDEVETISNYEDSKMYNIIKESENIIINGASS